MDQILDSWVRHPCLMACTHVEEVVLHLRSLNLDISHAL